MLPYVEAVIEKATADTKNETLGELKSQIYMMFYRSIALVTREGRKEKELLTQIAATGTKGFHAISRSDHDIVSGLMKRDSKSTLVRRRDATRIRIHDYSHALYLHGVKGPHEPNVEDKIKEVKEKFGMNPKSSSA